MVGVTVLRALSYWAAWSSSRIKPLCCCMRIKVLPAYLHDWATWKMPCESCDLCWVHDPDDWIHQCQRQVIYSCDAKTTHVGWTPEKSTVWFVQTQRSQIRSHKDFFIVVKPLCLVEQAMTFEPSRTFSSINIASYIKQRVPRLCLSIFSWWPS